MIPSGLQRSFDLAQEQPVSGYANSKAFEVAGIPEDVPNPPGGEYSRDAEGKLTGVMKNNVAFSPVASKNPAMATLDPIMGLITLLKKLSQFGLTTVSELSLGGLSQSPADVEVMMAAANSGQLAARVRAYPFDTIGTEAWDKAGVTDPVPLHMIEMAVTRRTWKEPDYVLAPQERISVETAIRAITSEAAWQLFSEQESGTLEAGKFADMVILDADPRTVEPDSIKGIKVLETWINGNRVYAA